MAINDTTPHAVPLKHIKDATKTGGNGNYEIRIPRFQRGQVWNKEMKETLIRSIKEGYPIGSLLAFESYEQGASGTKPRKIWSLIDGLQRTSTIVEYLNGPFTVASPELFYSKDSLFELTRLCFDFPSERNQHEIGNLLNRWLKERKSPSKENGFYVEHLVVFLETELIKKDFEADKRKEITVFLELKLLEEIKQKIDAIEDAQLPFLVYSGPEDNLSEIFERINTQGASLTKYETFAASWYSVNTIIENSAIKDNVKRKYKVLSDKGYEFTDLDDLEAEFSSYNLFEYLFGLGKLLAQKFPLLFPDTAKDDEPVPAAFVICAVAHQIKTASMSEMSKLASALKVIFGDPINLVSFEKALITSCQSVENSLRPFLDVKLNAKSSSTSFYPHSTNQIYSYVTRYLVEAYDHQNNWQPIQNSSERDLLRKIPLFYIYDIIRGEWAGSGDSRLFNKTWETIVTDEGRDAVTSYGKANDYLQAISLASWSSLLSGWHEDELSGLQKDRTNITSTAKVLLKFLYQEKLNVAENVRETFHIEHLWSVDKLKKTIKDKNLEGLPIGAFANLTLLPKDVNEKKKTVMLGDFYLKNREGLSEDRWAMLKKLVISPEIEELTETHNLDKKIYLDFLNARFGVLKVHLLRQVGFTEEQISELNPKT